MENIEKITKFCSKMNQIIGYPYFFNWSFPTNHVDNSKNGKMEDATYCIFRVGKYLSDDSRRNKEKEICFTRIAGIIDFVTIDAFVFQSNYMYRTKQKIQSFEDVEKYKKEIQKAIDDFLVDIAFTGKLDDVKQILIHYMFDEIVNAEMITNDKTVLLNNLEEWWLKNKEKFQVIYK